MQAKDKDFKQLLKQLEDASPEGGALDEACSKMQALVSAVTPPSSILADAGKLTSFCRIGNMKLTMVCVSSQDS